MDRFLVPTDVESALGHAGFRAVEAAGSGWLAAAADGSDRRVELHVVSGVLDEDRSARLRAVRHEHLPQVLDVVALSAGRLGLVVEHVLGLTLGQIRSARAPLTDGEAATVTIPVASALEALHDAGLAHGAVSESTIVVRPDGRPVLTDLRGALTGAADPESDVRRLVSTVLAQMPSADVHLVSDVAGQGTLRDVLTDLLTEPGLTAAHVVDECYRAAAPAPVRLPDAGALVSSVLTAGARTPASGLGSGRTRREERTRRRRRALRSGAALVATGIVVAAGLGVWRALDEDPAPDAGLATRTAAPDDPVAAAVDLSLRRAEVVSSGDPVALGDVAVLDGPAYQADSRLIAGLDGAQLDGLTADVEDAWLVDEDGSRAGTTDVAVRASMSGYARTPADGATTPVAAAPPRTVVLGLRWTEQGWRVWDVLEP